MLEHTKRLVDMVKTNMFIIAVCILFLIKHRWPRNKSLCKAEVLSVSTSSQPMAIVSPPSPFLQMNQKKNCLYQIWFLVAGFYSRSFFEYPVFTI